MAAEFHKQRALYFLFQKEVYAKVKAENPYANVEEISTIISQRWRELPPDDKLKYVEPSKPDQLAFETDVDDGVGKVRAQSSSSINSSYKKSATPLDCSRLWTFLRRARRGVTDAIKDIGQIRSMAEDCTEPFDFLLMTMVEVLGEIAVNGVRQEALRACLTAVHYEMSTQPLGNGYTSPAILRACFVQLFPAGFEAICCNSTVLKNVKKCSRIPSSRVRLLPVNAATSDLVDAANVMSKMKDLCKDPFDKALACMAGILKELLCSGGHHSVIREQLLEVAELLDKLEISNHSTPSGSFDRSHRLHIRFTKLFLVAIDTVCHDSRTDSSKDHDSTGRTNVNDAAIPLPADGCESNCLKQEQNALEDPSSNNRALFSAVVKEELDDWIEEPGIMEETTTYEMNKLSGKVKREEVHDRTPRPGSIISPLKKVASDSEVDDFPEDVDFNVEDKSKKRRHVSSWRFVCPHATCTSDFGGKRPLMTHIKEQHSKDPSFYQLLTAANTLQKSKISTKNSGVCKLCNGSYSFVRYGYRRHVTTHHKEQLNELFPHRCPREACDARFETADMCTTHFWRMCRWVDKKELREQLAFTGGKEDGGNSHIAGGSKTTIASAEPDMISGTLYASGCSFRDRSKKAGQARKKNRRTREEAERAKRQRVEEDIKEDGEEQEAANTTAQGGIVPGRSLDEDIGIHQQNGTSRIDLPKPDQQSTIPAALCDHQMDSYLLLKRDVGNSFVNAQIHCLHRLRDVQSHLISLTCPVPSSWMREVVTKLLMSDSRATSKRPSIQVFSTERLASTYRRRNRDVEPPCLSSSFMTSALGSLPADVEALFTLRFVEYRECKNCGPKELPRETSCIMFSAANVRDPGDEIDLEKPFTQWSTMADQRGAACSQCGLVPSDDRKRVFEWRRSDAQYLRINLPWWDATRNVSRDFKLTGSQTDLDNFKVAGVAWRLAALVRGSLQEDLGKFTFTAFTRREGKTNEWLEHTDDFANPLKILNDASALNGAADLYFQRV